MKSITRAIVLTVLFVAMFTSSSFANSDYGTTEYAKYNFGYSGSSTLLIYGTSNVKNTIDAKWRIIVDYVDISEMHKYPNCWGLKFTPMKQYSGYFGLCGADSVWAKGYKEGTASWNGNGTVLNTFYLGVRMDNDYSSSCTASSAGRWDSDGGN